MESQKSHVVCPVCEGTNYVLKDGAYYCVLCQVFQRTIYVYKQCLKMSTRLYSQTQSQELGAETVVDNEMLIDLGMVSFFFISADKIVDFKAYI